MRICGVKGEKGRMKEKRLTTSGGAICSGRLPDILAYIEECMVSS